MEPAFEIEIPFPNELVTQLGNIHEQLFFFFSNHITWVTLIFLFDFLCILSRISVFSCILYSFMMVMVTHKLGFLQEVKMNCQIGFICLLI